MVGKAKRTKSIKKASQKAQPYTKPAVHPGIVSTPRNFGLGGDIQPRRDLTRFVRWPKYIKLQRQRKILNSRLKVPPTLNQFTKTLDRNTATQLFRLLVNYTPETKQEKKQRLLKAAQAKAADEKEQPSKKPQVVKYGLNHITGLIEQKKAQLVVIAHDVDPIELVVWLPSLCRKRGVPYCIVKGKSRLGQIVHQKTATALAFTDIKNEHKNEFAALTKECMQQFNDNPEVRKNWGGGILGGKAQVKKNKIERAIRLEEKKKMGKA